MNDLDVKFLEIYKRFEKVLSDMFFCEHGVSEYISVMETKEKDYPIYCSKISCWKEDYKNLKHLRWLRNQITHNVDDKGGFCNTNDLIMLNNLYNKILHQEDALALLLKLQIKSKNNKKNSTNQEKNFITNEEYNYKKTKQQTAIAVIIAGLLVIFALLYILFEILNISSSALVEIKPFSILNTFCLNNFWFI